MSTKDFTANVISATKVVPDGNFKDSKASGIWDINEALDLIKGGNWPNAANINPAAFVDALFQTHLYTGTAQARSIVNGIDLSGKGGLIWSKNRSDATNHSLFDSERSNANAVLKSNATNAQYADNAHGVQFNNNGWSLTGTDTTMNVDGDDYVNWTFRKQPKFFDIVTYTGNGTAGRTVSHNLGSVPGMIIVKRTDTGTAWYVHHRELANTDVIFLEDSAARSQNQTSFLNSTTPTATEFTLGDEADVNGSGGTYVAYLFAHNNNDGGFGEPGDQDIIKCDSYTGNGGSTETGSPLAAIDVGFEPQLLMIKRASGAGNWLLVDNMRGFSVNIGNEPRLLWNTNDAEASSASGVVLTHSGFRIEDTDSEINGNNDTYIYMAIRRGGMKTPTAASDVFAVDSGENSSDPRFTSNFPVDFAFIKFTTGSDGFTSARLIQKRELILNTNAAEGGGNNYKFDFNNGWVAGSVGNNAISYMWKRARGYFDIVTYSGTGSARTVAHNLGVAPEMMWVKNRDNADDWAIYYGDNTDYLNLNDDGATADSASRWNDTSPTSSVFTVGTDHSVNASGEDYISFLFATVSGVSKVGSFSHTNGSTTDVDCGFTGDTPSFVLLKRYNTTGSWVVFDSTRGIVAGNDPFLKLDTTDAETTGNDVIDPLSGGFQVASGFLATGDWIFYAIAAIS